MANKHTTSIQPEDLVVLAIELRKAREALEGIGALIQESIIYLEKYHRERFMQSMNENREN